MVNLLVHSEFKKKKNLFEIYSWAITQPCISDFFQLHISEIGGTQIVVKSRQTSVTTVLFQIPTYKADIETENFST